MCTIILADEARERRARLRVALTGVAKEIREVATGWELLEVIGSQQEHSQSIAVLDSRLTFPGALATASMVRGTGVQMPFVIIGPTPPAEAQDVAHRLGGVTLCDLERAIIQLVVLIRACEIRAAKRPRLMGRLSASAHYR